MSISAFDERVPFFGRDVFVHPDATVIGDVVLRDGANVWPGVVLRGDTERIELGPRVSFQDNSVAHTDPGLPIVVGEDCVVGHGVIVHGATIGARCLIGMGSTLLNGCVIGQDSIVGAGSLITQGKVFAPHSLIMGSPAKVVREVTDADLEPRSELCERYAKRSLRYIDLGLAADLSAFR